MKTSLRFGYLPFLMAFFLLLLASSGCRREKLLPNKTLSAQLIDSSSGEPISGAVIEFYRSKSTGLLKNGRKRIDLESTQSDNLGWWSISYRQVGNRNYHLSLEHPDYYPEKRIISDYYEKEEVITMIPRAYIEITVSDSSGLYNEIHLEVDNIHSTGTGLTSCPRYLPITRVLAARGGTMNRLDWSLFPDGDCFRGRNPIHFSDSLMVPSGDTVRYELRI